MHTTHNTAHFMHDTTSHHAHAANQHTSGSSSAAHMHQLNLTEPIQHSRCVNNQYIQHTYITQLHHTVYTLVHNTLYTTATTFTTLLHHNAIQNTPQPEKNARQHQHWPLLASKGKGQSCITNAVLNTQWTSFHLSMAMLYLNCFNPTWNHRTKTTENNVIQSASHRTCARNSATTTAWEHADITSTTTHNDTKAHPTRSEWQPHPGTGRKKATDTTASIRHLHGEAYTSP